MIDSKMSQQGIERRRTPWDWRDLQNEATVRTNTKIRRAKELGVIAVLFDRLQVADRIDELAELEHTLRNGQIDQTIYATILKGGVQFATPFFSKMASIQPGMNPKVDYIQASRYGKTQKGGKLEIIRQLDPKTDFAGKTLMYVDDVTDEGPTLEGLLTCSTDEELCKSLGKGIKGPASKVGAIVLGDKQIASYAGFDPEMVIQGFWLPNAWAGGVGLDGPDEAMRWIPELVLTSTQHEKYRNQMPEILDVLNERAVLGMNDITWVSN